MKYELMVILSPKQTDKEIEKNLKEIKGLLGESDFNLVDEDIWGTRELAYKIKGHSKGYYAVLVFEGESANLPEFQKDLRLQAGIVRAMLIKVPDDYVLLRYEQLGTTGQAAKISSPAEELNKKVRSKKSEKVEEENPAENKEKLDETLKAIIEDKDIDL